ncbi:MAG: hypothetical protein SGBAC_011778 [Bacillariaceae sp.]
MFHHCQMAMRDYDEQEERDWQLHVSKSRKRQRTKRKDDAAVAAFFGHVDDPFASQILLGLLLDCSRNEDCHHAATSNCVHQDTTQNLVELKQEAFATPTHEVDEIAYMDMEQGGLKLHVIQEDEEEEDQSYQANVVHPEPTSLLHMTESKSEGGEAFAFEDFSADNNSSHLDESTSGKPIVVKIAMKSIAPNVKLLRPAEKENLNDNAMTISRSPKLFNDKMKSSSVRNSMKSRRTPLYETKNPMISSRQL